MIQTTSTMIYIGNLPIMDTVELPTLIEFPTTVIGTYIADEMQIVNITDFDFDEDGAIQNDEVPTLDYVSYTLRGENETFTQQDSIINYLARITEKDGTIHDVDVSVIQMPNGDTFVNDIGNTGATDDLDIDTIELIIPISLGLPSRDTSVTTSNTTICFTKGTLISTPDGDRPVESLVPGSLVNTLDDGPQPVLWRRRERRRMPASNAPIYVEKGALGRGLPWQRLGLSPQHRVFINAPAAQRMFGQQEVLVAAKRLLPLEGIAQAQPPVMVDYWHFLLARHQIVFANGAPVETLWLGEEVRKIVPSQLQVPPSAPWQTARFVPRGNRQKRLVQRLLRNGQKCLGPSFGPLPLHPRIGAVPGKDTPEAAWLVQ